MQALKSIRRYISPKRPHICFVNENLTGVKEVILNISTPRGKVVLALANQTISHRRLEGTGRTRLMISDTPKGVQQLTEEQERYSKCMQFNGGHDTLAYGHHCRRNNILRKSYNSLVSSFKLHKDKDHMKKLYNKKYKPEYSIPIVEDALALTNLSKVVYFYDSNFALRSIDAESDTCIIQKVYKTVPKKKAGNTQPRVRGFVSNRHKALNSQYTKTRNEFLINHVPKEISIL